jgi:hypothetical protein
LLTIDLFGDSAQCEEKEQMEKAEMSNPAPTAAISEKRSRGTFLYFDGRPEAAIRAADGH